MPPPLLPPPRGGVALLRFGLFWTAGYAIPTALLSSGVVPFHLRHYALVAFALGLLGWAAWRRLSAAELGLLRRTTSASMREVLPVTAVGIGLLFLASWTGETPPEPIDDPEFVTFYVIVSAPLQEFCFRSLLFAELRACGIRNGKVQVLISAATFAAAHFHYEQVTFVLLTFAAGLVWGALYRRTPNLLGVSISHAVLGITAIALGMG